MRSRLFLPLLAVIVLPACTATIPPVEVTRFHLGQPIAAGSATVSAAPGIDGGSIEFRTYALAVQRELTRLGYSEGANPAYLAEISYFRDSRARLAKRSPVTIGIGGGSFGGNVGVGLGTSFGLGGDGSKADIVSRLEVRLKTRSDGAVVWEGRAQTEAPANAPAAQPGLAAEKLSRALFADFPGESGKTITVP
jgi:hypothetical protein